MFSTTGLFGRNKDIKQKSQDGEDEDSLKAESTYEDRGIVRQKRKWIDLWQAEMRRRLQAEEDHDEIHYSTFGEVLKQMSTLRVEIHEESDDSYEGDDQEAFFSCQDDGVRGREGQLVPSRKRNKITEHFL